MSKIKDRFISGPFFDFRTGSYQDLSDNNYNASMTKANSFLKRSKDGRYMKFSGVSKIQIGNNAGFEKNEPSTYLWRFRTTRATTMAFLSKSEGAAGYKGFNLYMDSSGRITFRMYDNGTGSGINAHNSTPAFDGKWHTCVCTYDGSETEAGITIYIDGVPGPMVLAGNSGFTGSILNSEDWTLAQASYGGLNFDGDLAYLAEYNVYLSNQEVAQLYEELEQEGSFDVTGLQKLTNPSRTLIVDGDMEAVGVTDWTAVNSATVTKETATPKEGTRYIRVAKSAGGNFPYIKQGTAIIGERYRVTGYARTDGTVGVARLFISNLNNPITVATTSDWTFFDKTVTATSTTTLVAFMALTSGAVGEYCEFDNILVQQIANEDDIYMADGQGWNDTLQGVTAGQLDNSGWWIQSGEHIIGSSPNSSRKEIAVISAGIVSRPSYQAYGTWEFEMKHSPTTDTRLYFIADSTNNHSVSGQSGYMFSVLSTERLAIHENNGDGTSTTKLTTAQDYIPTNQYVRYRITRTAGGIFTVSLSYDSGKSWTTATAESGANPFTDTTYSSSKFAVFNGGANDAIRNFRFLPYIE